ncbi:hypothetical protein FHS81_003576 [Pseudochelatococcus contaminans]|uniref:Uncharacterized protein n=1 Tax=Pseudochelatococcus contaminans TaxID=1538103 RepID=A0A7W6EIV9_9HYPH|nr:hypothetical protein [Pseudochelatococcus contaminans]
MSPLRRALELAAGTACLIVWMSGMASAVFIIGG